MSEQIQTSRRRLNQIDSQVQQQYALEAKQSSQEEIEFLNKYSKRQLIEQKVDKILGKTKDRLKLDNQDPQKKFDNRYFKEMKNLHTFIDAQKSLQRLNILNDKNLVRQINFFKQNLKLQGVHEKQIVEQAMRDQLLYELNMPQPDPFQIIDEDILRLEIVKDDSPNKPGTSIDPKKYYQSLQIISESDSIVNKYKQIKTTNQAELQARLDDRIDLNLVADEISNRPTQNLFYQSVRRALTEEKKKNNYQEEHSNKNQTKAKDLERANKVLEQIEKTFGMNVDDKYMNLEGGIHKKFKTQSDNLLRNLRRNAQIKFEDVQESIKKSMTVHVGLSSQQRIQLDKMIYKKQIGSNPRYQSVKSRYAAEVSTASNASTQNLKLKTDKLFMTKSITPTPSKKQVKFKKNAFDARRERQKLGRDMDDLLEQVDEVQSQLVQENKEDMGQIMGLDNDMEIMEQKYNLNKKLKSLGFNSHDPELNLRSQLRSSIKNAIKSIRTIKMIRYY